MHTNPNIQTLDDGTLPEYAWPGGYQLYYYVKNNSNGYDLLCTTCANKEPREDVAYQQANYEDNDMHCDGCNKQIPASYGD